MALSIYQVDAFGDGPFTGNPASVCPLDAWLPDDLLQAIAAENNQAETAFLVRRRDRYEIRWFTPVVEVDLCGHATLAAGFIVFTEGGHAGDRVVFESRRSGELAVARRGELFVLDFPRDDARPTSAPAELVRALGGQTPMAAYQGKTDLMLVYEREAQVAGMAPDLAAVANAGGRGLIVTAPGDRVDFVSRFFAPQCGIPEDPVTGSAHTTLAPYWAGRTGKTVLTAMQLSRRRGFLECALAGDRVHIAGRAFLYMSGRLHLEER